MVGVAAGGWGGGTASVSTPNDSLGQLPLHMLSGERETRMQTQTNRWREEKGD